MKPKYFSIPEPCHEDWNKMTPTECGAFCQKCTKEVLDFTDKKPSQIKKSLKTVKDPCVRINTYQIDVLNFTEWFNHLTIKNQIKYVFLFAFIFVFHFKLVAQPEEDQLRLDSADITTTSELLNEIDDTIIPEIEHPILFATSILFDDIIATAGVWIDIPMTGSTMVDYDYPITVSTETPINNPHLVLELEYDSTINIQGNSYGFYIKDDSLYFDINAITNQEISLSATLITLDNYPMSINKKVYFEPMLIGIGKKMVVFPLTDFLNGTYRITIKSGEEYQSIQLIYW